MIPKSGIRFSEKIRLKQKAHGLAAAGLSPPAATIRTVPVSKMFFAKMKWRRCGR
jgi:hypothetical protein